MRKSIITAIVFVSLLSVLSVKAGNIELRSDAPNHHVVVPGDTLWGIAAKFLKDPWRWTQIWGLNREQIKNPHKIYPGEIVILEKTQDGHRLRISKEIATVKLSPKIRSEKTGISAIPSIPAAAIEPFLSQPIVVDKNGLENAPYVLGSSDNRVALSTGDTIYIKNLPESQGSSIWQIFRPGKALKDPDADGQILGYEATYLGDVKVKVFDNISTATITRAILEIRKGDRLVASPGILFNNYAPHAPELPIKGRIVSVYGGVTEIGKGAIVTLNKGANDGLEMGHVLAVYRRSQARTLEGQNITLPDERTGLVFIFRIFDTLSYALVMQSTQSIQILDAVRIP
ncbi:MAG: LysM peptidoglycan-binding domain-containing protein [Nitrosomonas sp.]|nr:LysM peptidoglycan-binding domain-containing protein [Nitrosomonas sp.]MDP1951963.1 LysM peptidoglycan-binding domain-containing protein [Nitrosomonas sp.]